MLDREHCKTFGGGRMMAAPVGPTPMRCHHCDAENRSGARFCGRCGQLLQNACPACGTATIADERFCTGCGHDLARPAPPKPARSEDIAMHAERGFSAPSTDVAEADEGERRQATVVFADLAGYTALTERRDPEEVEALLTLIKREATRVVERYGGTVNQFVGDEVMALFGVPVARRDDPARAVAAALELHAAVREVVKSSQLGHGLAMHTGICTGLIVTRRSDARAGTWSCTGDTVNLGARLRSVAGADELLVDAETWRQLADAYEGDALPPQTLKGKEHPVAPYRVRVLKAARSGDGPLVGRDEELQQFASWASMCAERQRGRVVIVRGDPGVGKSRLVGEFLRRAAETGFSPHLATVLDFGAETGRDAVRSLARSLLGLAPQADTADRRVAVARFASVHGLEPEAQIGLSDLLDVAPDVSSLESVESRRSSSGQGSIFVLADLVRRRVTEHPLLLCVEDIHWADPWTLERLTSLASLAGRLPLVLVLTTRFAGDPTAGAWRTALHGAPVVSMDVGPLHEADALKLATGASSMPVGVIRGCVQRAEGNPLFLLQLLANAGEVAQAQLPGSVQALVQMRMDRLPAADKTAMQAGAVLGQRFALEALRHLIEHPDYDCDLLVDQFLVRRDGAEFMFCHALIRDGAYASMLNARRRTLHARAASWLSIKDPTLAAEHSERAGDPDAALAFLRAAQAAARRRGYSMTPALGLIDRGLALAATDQNRFPLLMGGADIYLALGHTNAALDFAQRALAIAASPTERAQALIAMAAGMRLDERIADGLVALDRAEPIVRECGLHLEAARLHHLRGNLLFALARAEACLREHEAALAAARIATSAELETAALGGLADASYLTGRMRTACDQFKACADLAKQRNLVDIRSANLPMVAWTAYQLLDWQEADEAAYLTVRRSFWEDLARAELVARTYFAWVDCLASGDYFVAEQAAFACQELIESLGARRFEAQMRGLAAVCAWRCGERDRPVEQARIALELCKQHGMEFIGAWVTAVCGLVDPEPDARRRWLTEAEAELVRGSVSHNHIWVREMEIDVFLDLGDWDAVEEACERLRAYTAAEPLPLPDLRIARGKALARHGRGERGAVIAADLAELRDRIVAAKVNADLPAVERAVSEQEGVPFKTRPRRTRREVPRSF
jgi:class 3 adenylate cyclase